jgi:hypothetical protein
MARLRRLTPSAFLLDRGGRPRAYYYNRPSSVVHDYDSLVGWTPKTPVLAFGQSWTLRCLRTSDYGSCRAGAEGGVRECTGAVILGLDPVLALSGRSGSSRA